MSGGHGGGSMHYWKGVARGFGGALLFSLPLYLTMEMWWLGFYMNPLRLALLLALGLPLLVGLASISGMERTHGKLEAVIGGLTGYGIGVVSSAAVLAVLGILGPADPLPDVVGKIGVQALPAGIGAALARSQLGGDGRHREKARARKKQKHGDSYLAELFLMMAGALYVAFTVAATQEMDLVPYSTDPWHILGAAALTVAVMHAFVYAMEFNGAPEPPENTPWWSLFLRYTCPAYAVALGVSLLLLWLFGRLESAALAWVAMRCVVLGIPAGLGAAAARLIL